MSDDALKAAYARHRQPAGDHLSETTWEQLACGELSEPQRRDALAHIASCADCTAIHRSVLALSKEAAQFDPAAVSQPAQAVSSRQWWYFGGLAAAAVFAAIVIDVRRPAPDPTADVVRSSQVTTDITITAPRADAALDRRRLAWQPVAAADSYDVLINAPDGAVIWSTKVSATDATIPADVSIQPGRYYVLVRAFGRDGIVARSTLVPFRVE